MVYSHKRNRVTGALSRRSRPDSSRIGARVEEVGSHVRQRPLTTVAIVAASALALGTLANFARRGRSRHGLQRISRRWK
jgi:hypothetical protein